ncbi:MAG TPA: hypothetical protein P5280_09785, partial [Cyclobacteriaceae bacterium]|nr:hypothetical protein [Cyclobacteriaceae bacterium]
METGLVTSLLMSSISLLNTVIIIFLLLFWGNFLITLNRVTDLEYILLLFDISMAHVLVTMPLLIGMFYIFQVMYNLIVPPLFIVTFLTVHTVKDEVVAAKWKNDEDKKRAIEDTISTFSTIINVIRRHGRPLIVGYISIWCTSNLLIKTPTIQMALFGDYDRNIGVHSSTAFLSSTLYTQTQSLLLSFLDEEPLVNYLHIIGLFILIAFALLVAKALSSTVDNSLKTLRGNDERDSIATNESHESESLSQGNEQKRSDRLISVSMILMLAMLFLINRQPHPDLSNWDNMFTVAAGIATILAGFNSFTQSQSSSPSDIHQLPISPNSNEANTANEERFVVRVVEAECFLIAETAFEDKSPFLTSRTIFDWNSLSAVTVPLEKQTHAKLTLALVNRDQERIYLKSLGCTIRYRGVEGDPRMNVTSHSTYSMYYDGPNSKINIVMYDTNAAVSFQEWRKFEPGEKQLWNCYIKLDKNENYYLDSIEFWLTSDKETYSTEAVMDKTSSFDTLRLFVYRRLDNAQLNELEGRFPQTED